MFFLSESTLLVLTSGLEIRILYTELFYPDRYIPNALEMNKKNFMINKDGQKREPVLDKGYFLKNVAHSEHGSTY